MGDVHATFPRPLKQRKKTLLPGKALEREWSAGAKGCLLHSAFKRFLSWSCVSVTATCGYQEETACLLHLSECCLLFRSRSLSSFDRTDDKGRTGSREWCHTTPSPGFSQYSSCWIRHRYLSFVTRHTVHSCSILPAQARTCQNPKCHVRGGEEKDRKEKEVAMPVRRYATLHEKTFTTDHLEGMRSIQCHHSHRSRQRLIVQLVLFGCCILISTIGQGGSDRQPQVVARSSSAQTSPLSVRALVQSTALSATGMGAGKISSAPAHDTSHTTPADICLNPLDTTCWLNNAAQWLAQHIMDALQPVVILLMKNPLSILFQTPPADTYSNATVMLWWKSFLAVADLALGCLIVVGGYNAIVGRHLGLRHSELTEFLPRLILAFGAASFSLYFLGLFIDLENALCGVALNLAGTSVLTNVILSLFQGNLVNEGLLVWLLAVVVCIMALLLGVQMAVRLALLWVLLVLAGPGLACLALSQTVGYGRMWLSLTANTVLVQFFQVVALALGGSLITAIGVTNILNLDGILATLVLCVALLYLVLRLPGIVSRSTLRPMLEASAAATGAAQGAAEYVANVAPRLLALL